MTIKEMKEMLPVLEALVLLRRDDEKFFKSIENFILHFAADAVARRGKDAVARRGKPRGQGERTMGTKRGKAAQHAPAPSDANEAWLRRQLDGLDMSGGQP